MCNLESYLLLGVPECVMSYLVTTQSLGHVYVQFERAKIKIKNQLYEGTYNIMDSQLGKIKTYLLLLINIPVVYSCRLCCRLPSIYQCLPHETLDSDKASIHNF